MTAAGKQTIWHFLKLASSLPVGFATDEFAHEPSFEDDPAVPTAPVAAANEPHVAQESPQSATHSPAQSTPSADVQQESHRTQSGAPVDQSSAAAVEADPSHDEAASSADQSGGIGASLDEIASSLDAIALRIKECRSCVLCQKRMRCVPGEGVLTPAVLVVGEGPGADEDRTGRPFVGRAGQLLDKMLASICLSRTANCYIANAVKCRPPMNRTPMSDEVSSCRPFLREQILALHPHFILAMGRSAASSLLGTTAPLNTLRGKWFDYDSGGTAIPLLVTYHPSALLRDESLKRPAWEDLKLLRARLQKQLPLYAKPFHAQI